MSTAVKLDNYRKTAAKDFMNFALDCSNSDKGEMLTKEFKKMVLTGNSLNLYNWFNNKGYDISIEDCEKIIDNKENLKKFKEHVMDSSY